MNSTFQPYIHDRLIDKSASYYIITPQEYKTPVPLSCPVCENVMRTCDDERAWNVFQCCDLCSMCWAAANREKWTSGWRPDQTVIDEEIKKRMPFIVSFASK